jgi:MFS family permease
MPSDDCITLTTSADADASSPLLPTPSSPEGLVDLRGGTLSVHPDGEHYSYAYGPTGLAGLCANTYTLRCAVFASLGGLTFGYDQGVIANVLVMQDFRTRWPVGPWELGLMSTCSHDDYLTRGARLNVVRSQRRCSSWVVSSACWPQACSRTGSRGGPRLRRPVVSDFNSCRSVLIRYPKAVFCVGSALQTWARSLTQLTGGRAIGGIGVGALRYGLPSFRRSKHSMVHPTRSTLSPLYMAEISPPEVRGSILALEQFSIVLGCVLGFWTGFLTRNSKSNSPCLGSRITNAAVVPGSLSWRIPLGLQLVPGILLGLGAFALPDSPRLLVLHGRREAALASLAKLRLRSLAEARTDPLIQVRAC